jgi:hypothetical protein
MYISLYSVFEKKLKKSELIVISLLETFIALNIQ